MKKKEPQSARVISVNKILLERRIVHLMRKINDLDEKIARLDEEMLLKLGFLKEVLAEMGTRVPSSDQDGGIDPGIEPLSD